MNRFSLGVCVFAMLLIGCGQKDAAPAAGGEGATPSAETTASNTPDDQINWGKNASEGATLDDFNAKFGPLVKEGNALVTQVVDASKDDPKKNLGPALEEVLPKLKETAEAIGNIPCPEGTVMIDQEIKAMFEDIHMKFDLYKTAVGNGIFDDVARLESEVTDTASEHLKTAKQLLAENGFEDEPFMADEPKLVKKG